MPELGTNGYDAQQLRGLADEILDQHEAIASLNAVNAEKVATHRGNIGGAYKRAKAQGFNVKALKEHIKTILEDKKREERRMDFDIDDRSALEMIKDALGGFGELPLGQAAIRAAGGAEEEGEVRPRHLIENERQREQENTERLKAGIKPLNEKPAARGRKSKGAAASLEDLETLGSVN